MVPEAHPRDGHGQGALAVLTADLHVHSCLSPCASLDMTPQKIVRQARRKELSVIAITDHNSAENVQAVIEAAGAASDGSSGPAGPCVMPGLEVTSSEEVHVVALFPTAERALEMQQLVFDHLLPGENNEDLFGMQVIANARDEVEGFNKRLLVGATTLSVDHVVDAIHRLEGLAIASHIDRETYSVIGQLGFIPEGLALDAVEISRHMALAEAKSRFKQYSRFPFITASDGHRLEDIAVGAVRARMDPEAIARGGADALGELQMALEGRQGREILD